MDNLTTLDARLKGMCTRVVGISIHRVRHTPKVTWTLVPLQIGTTVTDRSTQRARLRDSLDSSNEHDSTLVYRCTSVQYWCSADRIARFVFWFGRPWQRSDIEFIADVDSHPANGSAMDRELCDQRYSVAQRRCRRRHDCGGKNDCLQ